MKRAAGDDPRVSSAVVVAAKWATLLTTLAVVCSPLWASGLLVTSTIRTTKLVTLTRTMVHRWLGRLGPLVTADLDRALAMALGINTIPYREEGRRDERSRLVALYGAGGAAAVLTELGLPAS